MKGHFRGMLGGSLGELSPSKRQVIGRRVHMLPHLETNKATNKKPSRWPEQKMDYVILRGGGWDDGRRENRHDQRLTRYVHLWNCYAKTCSFGHLIRVNNNNKRRVTRAGDFC